MFDAVTIQKIIELGLAGVAIIVLGFLLWENMKTNRMKDLQLKECTKIMLEYIREGVATITKGHDIIAEAKGEIGDMRGEVRNMKGEVRSVKEVMVKCSKK